MAWKHRNGRAYYYKSMRLGREVRTLYFGAGPLAAGVAFLDDDARERRESLRERRQRAEVEDQEFAAWFDRVEAVAEAALLAAGYHKHHRSQWRKRRGHREGTSQVGAAGTPGRRQGDGDRSD